MMALIQLSILTYSILRSGRKFWKMPPHRWRDVQAGCSSPLENLRRHPAAIKHTAQT